MHFIGLFMLAERFNHARACIQWMLQPSSPSSIKTVAGEGGRMV